MEATPLSLSSALVFGAKPSNIGVILSIALSVAGEGKGWGTPGLPIEFKIDLVGVEFSDRERGDIGWSSFLCTEAGKSAIDKLWSDLCARSSATEREEPEFDGLAPLMVTGIGFD